MPMAAIFNCKMAACWTESDSKSKWIEMLEIRHTWVFSVTSNLRMSRNQWSSYMSVCKIHLSMAAILNSKIVAYCSELNSRRKWIEMLEIVFNFSLLSNLLLTYKWVKIRDGHISVSKKTWYGGHFEFQDGGKLNWFKFQKKVNWNA